jgi:hypothetical protein
LLSPVIVALAWMWFISLLLLIIITASFIRSIPPSTSYKKTILSLHILNVVLWFLIYYLLPKPAPCDAALMENHFKTHQDNMYDLVNYVRSSLNDSCSIVLLYRNDDVQEFTIRNGDESSITTTCAVSSATRTTSRTTRCRTMWRKTRFQPR